MAAQYNVGSQILDANFRRQVIQMQERAHQCGHVAHGHGHVDASECRMDFLVVRTVHQIRLVQVADFLAGSGRRLKLVLNPHQLQERWCQVETYG